MFCIALVDDAVILLGGDLLHGSNDNTQVVPDAKLASSIAF